MMYNDIDAVEQSRVLTPRSGAHQVMSSNHPSAAQPWSLVRRMLFRFVCCYWLLYAVPWLAPLYGLIHVRVDRRWYVDLSQGVSRWVGVHVFHVPGLATARFARGDENVLDYIYFVLVALAALAFAVIWSQLDRRRGDYHSANGWLRVFVRYMLAIGLLQYGLMKVFPTQFQALFGLRRLMEPFGEFSPAGVLWNFMAISIPYTVFTGLIETLAAVLLLFRRTTTLGALLALAAMTNVLALDISYGVGARLTVTGFLLMSLFLLAPVLRNLISVVVWNQATAAAQLDAPHFPRGWRRIAASTFAVVFVGANLFAGRAILTRQWTAYQWMNAQPHSPVYGLYRVESGGPPGWYKVAFDSPRLQGFPHTMVVRTLDDRVQSFPTDFEPGTKQIVLTEEPGRPSLNWNKEDSTHLVVSGTLRGTPITMRLRRIDQDLPLVKYEWHLTGAGDLLK